jgi:glutamine synthetase
LLVKGAREVSFFAEYIWIDGTAPVAKLRSKTKVISGTLMPAHSLDSQLKYPVDLGVIPVWGFDGSSTKQAEGSSSDCILKPVRVVPDPLRLNGILVLCEVLNADETPGKNNNRARAEEVADQYADESPLFGIEQEYTFFKGRSPLGWPENGYPAPQGPFYCGVGADEVFGRDIVEEHMQACLKARLPLSGVNAEVMPGQWEFQIGPADTLEVSDSLWLARYLLYRIAEKHGVNVKLTPKPVEGDWNGAGAHTNFSTLDMRNPNGIEACEQACQKIQVSFEKTGFPEVYGHGYDDRLTGAHETCSFEQFKWGVGDRTASVRIPLHVKVNGRGYIEDRRPCANIDPYEVCAFLIETVCS